MKELNPAFPVFESNGGGEEAREIILDVRFPSDAPIVDTAGREYEFVGKFLADDDFYQGLNMVSVIQRKSDGMKFGYQWWDDISKYGESYVDANGDEFGLECDTDADDFDWDNDYVSYYVFEPVEEYSIKSYRKADDVQATS